MKSVIKKGNKKIALLGLGLENKFLLDFLLKINKKTDISICDFRDKKLILEKYPEIKKNKQIKWQTGEAFNKNLDKFELIFRSPGWPINCPGIQEAIKKDTKLSSAMNVFFEFCPSKNIVGVSGTKGKGTTASLIFEIIKNSGKKCFLGGNIGVAPLSFIKNIKKNDWVVLELSSFQLEDLNFSPKIGVFTNLFKEHLSPADPNNPNFHKNINEYLNAKMKLAFYQNKNDHLIVNKKLKNKIKKYQINSKIFYFSKSNTKSNLSGDYNQENIAAAEEVAKILKIKSAIIKNSIEKFSNLNHRLELVREINNVKYYDNSFSTTPESTILDLQSFKDNIILLAGGADKGADFKKLAKEIKKRVKFLILFPGKGSEKIKERLKENNYPEEKIFEARSMEVAVKKAKKNSSTKDIVLLSTACASFGLFKNYKERGDLFQEEVKKQKI